MRCTHVFLFTMLSVLFLTGCEEDVIAVTGIDRPFTIYGVLTPQSDTQRVAVFNIEDRLQPIQPLPLDARITSFNLDADTSHSWLEQIVQDSLGQYAHVYSSPFKALYNNSYRIEVERSDGALTLVEVTVPPLTHLELPPQLMTMPTVFPVSVIGEAPRLLKIEITYRVKFDVGGFIAEERFTVVYDGQEERSLRGWTINVNVRRDINTLRSILIERGRIASTTVLKPVELKVNLIVANEEWNPPGGSFDPDVLSQPGLLTNVDNGFGFVGAGYRLSGKWAPLDSILVSRNF